MNRAGKTWMVALVLLIMVNAILLAGVWRNRSGEPDAVIVLTERELPIAWRANDDSGVALALSWNTYRSGRDDWLDRAKLEEIGFDCDPPLNADTSEFHYDKLLPREALVVLEFEGTAWEQWLAEQRREIDELAEKAEPDELEERKERFEREKATRSRLYAVDAGLDAEVLRQRYPERDRYIIAPAIIDLLVEPAWDPEVEEFEPPRLTGRVSEILVNRIHASRRHREAFGPLLGRRSETGRYLARMDADAPGPRYEVTLSYGGRQEPWITKVTPLEPEIRGDPATPSGPSE